MKNGQTSLQPTGSEATTAFSAATAVATIHVGDTTAPLVQSIARLDASPTSATSVSFSVVFSETVERVDSTDFTLATTDSVSGTVSSVTGSGTSYTVTVSGIAGSGTLGLDFDANHLNIRDLAGNDLSLVGFGGSEVYEVEGDTNNAPVLSANGTQTLAAINEDDTNAAGDIVANIVGDSHHGCRCWRRGRDRCRWSGWGRTGNGSWQFSTDGGVSWTTFAAVSTSSARLLRDVDKVRYLPQADFNGAATITYHAWDQTTGSAGGTADLSTTGGATAFSTAADTASITVNPVNDAPVLEYQR